VLTLSRKVDECKPLLHGPPGVGKTAAVRAVAEEAGLYRVLDMSAADDVS